MRRFVAGCRHDAALAGSADGDRLAAKIRIVPLLDGCIEGVHVDVDDLALAARGSCLVVIVLVGHVVWPGRIFLDAAGDDPERPVRKRPLQLQGLVRRGRHPGLDFVRRRQDHRHRLGVDGADLGVRLRREERVEVVGRLAFLDLPDGRPVGPDAGEAGEGTGLIEREPDVAALGLVELAEGVERHHAAVFGSQPSRPVFALHVADVGRAAVRLHPQQFLEIDGLALGLQLFGSFLGGVHQRL